MDAEGEMIRKLLATGDPEVVRSGLRGMGWPDSVAFEQAQSVRLGLPGVQEQMERLAGQYPRTSPGPEETLLGVQYGRKPSPRAVLRKREDARRGH